MPTVQPTCTCAAPCLSPICDQGFRPAREMIRVMRAADAKENRTDSHLQVLITTSMLTNIARGSENTAAQRLSPWRKGTRRRERRAQKARERDASSCSERTATERGAGKEHQRRVAPSTRCALCETTSVARLTRGRPGRSTTTDASGGPIGGRHILPGDPRSGPVMGSWRSRTGFGELSVHGLGCSHRPGGAPRVLSL